MVQPKEIAPGVWAVGSGLPYPIQAFVVARDQGLTLIDTGLVTMARSILTAIASTGLPLARIVLTHAHFDHTGGLAAILRRWPVEVLAHPEELPGLRRTGPGGLAARLGLLRGLAANERPGGLEPRHCPGHTPGHTAYWAPWAGLLIAGDLFSAYRPGRIGRPTPFLTADMAQAVRSGALVMHLRPRLLAVCHGHVIERPDRLYPAYRRRQLGAGA